ncbi:MAG TPA: 16S rRNA (uracil(1498)-N(3))-methyltransferase [Pirellulales bacterium]|nr:16S rRNA (uracil(1498)-N(3))-methyltransferase [Pirellulales bacterium]
MSKRFFAQTPINGDRVTLEGVEAHHLARVMRAQVGDVVTLFDGSGCECMAEIAEIGKSHVEFVVRQRREMNRESPLKLTLVIALPKGDRQRWLVEKTVELGVATLIPLETHRGVAQPSAAALERLQRAVIEASKQCGRNRLMEIAAPQAWSTFAAAFHGPALRLVAHPGGEPLHGIRSNNATMELAEGVVAAIGPEGGFTNEEIAQAVTAGWMSVDLGPRILRVETAAITMAAWAALIGIEIC